MKFIPELQKETGSVDITGKMMHLRECKFTESENDEIGRPVL